MLNLVTAISAIIAIILFCACMPYERYIGDDGLSYAVDIMGSSVLAYSAGLSLILFTVDFVCYRRKKDPMHPAIPLTFHLLGWTSVFSLGVICAMLTADNYYNGYDERDRQAASFVSGAQKVAIAFLFIVV
jgi:cation transporter-like permease